MHHPKLWIAAFLPGILAVALALGGHAAHAAGVVTDCSSDAQLRTMLASFGEITFNCGGTNNPAVIVVSPTLTLAMGNTTLDGGGRVTLSGSDHHRLFVVSGDILYGTPFAFTLRHITLTNGYEAASVGGCMLIGFFATVTLDDVTVQNCRTDPGGQAGGIENSLGNLIVLNSRVLNNSADAAGGIRNGFGAITIANTLVAHNRAISGTGGGLGVPYGSAVISGSTFYSNSATVGGGGLSADAGTQVRIVGSRVENNRARYLAGQTFGGGIRSAGALTISTTTITGNLANVGQSSTWGGGLYHEGGALSLANVVVQANRSIHGAGVQVASGSATMAGVTFANNGATLASGDGGGLGTGAATVSLTATTFSGNYALREGGGIYNRGTLTVSNSTFTGNGAYNGGGGILNWFGSAVIVNSTLSGNSASGSGIGYGGGILNRNAPMTLTATTVCGNTAHYDGGGIYNSGTLSLNGATVCNNTMDGGDEVGMPPLGGGGIFNAGTANVFSSTLSGNRVFQLDGGGLYNRGGTAFVGNSTLNGNTAAQDGGGIKNENGVVTVQNSTVSGNSAVEWGGGILSNFGQTNLLHVTLSGNAAIAGGGIYQLTTDPNRKVYLQNTLIANSKPENCAQFSGSLDVVSGGYNLSDDNAFNAVSGFCPSFGGTDLANATDNLGPLANNGGPTRTHLPLPGSQAIDAIPIGANGCGTTYTGDQRQLPRPLDGNGDLVAKCDIGAVEYLLGEKTPMLYLPLIRR